MDNKHFDVRELIRRYPTVSLFNIVGQGGVGKSFSTKVHVLEQFFKNGAPFIYVRRWTTDIMKDNLMTVFDDVVEDPEVHQMWKEWADEKYPYMHILPSGGWFYLYGEKDNGSLEKLAKIGKAAALSQATRFKGGTYNNYSTIFFDEFITDERYVSGEKEPNRLDKIVNTVAREVNPAKIICCGNPDYFMEMCPYLKQLQLDYEHMQSNTVYLYDSINKQTGKILADNVLFIKLAGFNNAQGYLNERTSNLWQTAEGDMRITGEVKTNKYKSTSDEFEKSCDPYYELVIETGVMANNEFNKKIYAYIVETPEYGPAVIVKRHRDQNMRERSDWSIFCRYDELKMRRHDCDVQILRLRIPPGQEFAPLQVMLKAISAGRMFYAEDDTVGTLFEAILDYDK